jgi:hypothetical protein
VKIVQEFNQTMNDIYLVTLHIESAQVEATQAFHRSRQSQENTSYKKRALVELQQARRLRELVKALVNVFAEAPRLCQTHNSAHIHLSGLGKNQIDMLMSVCGDSKKKLQMANWAGIGSSRSPYLQHNPIDPFCDLLQNSQTGKFKPWMQLQPDGCWNSQNRKPDDRCREVKIPTRVLSDWLRPREDGEIAPAQPSLVTREEKLRLALNIARSLLYLLGIPLIQMLWKSQSILIADTADGSFNGLKIKPCILGELRGCSCEEDSC